VRSQVLARRDRRDRARSPRLDRVRGRHGRGPAPASRGGIGGCATGGATDRRGLSGGGGGGPCGHPVDSARPQLGDRGHLPQV
ncbi:MAG: hypothetical protein AVDCRST_MAG59-1758, partial [uncultured Thermomicrobiales bacterium]